MADSFNEWDFVPRSPEGRPQITVSKSPFEEPPKEQEVSPYSDAEPVEAFNPWERAAQRVKQSNVGKLPTAELDWSQVPKEFMRGVREGPLSALKSWYETTEGRYYPDKGAYLGDDNRFYESKEAFERGEPIPDQRKPTILPVTPNPEGGVDLAMPGILDVWNTLGSPVKGAATLGAGVTRHGIPGVGHNQGPPLHPPGPPVPPGAGPPLPPPPGAAPPPMAPGPASTRQIIRGQDDQTKLTWDERYTRLIDDLHPLKKLQDEVAQQGALAPDEQFYQLARLTRGSYGRAQQALDNGTYDFHTLQNNGVGLKQVLNPVRNNMDAFEEYAVAVRDIELLNRGIDPGVTRTDAMAKINAAAAHPEFRTALRNLHGYQDRILEYLGDSGILSPQALANIRANNRAYVPFNRAMDTEEIMGMARNLKPGNPIYKIQGSQRDILSPLETIVRNTHKFLDLAEKNRALNALVDAAQTRGLHGLVQDAGAANIFNRPGPDQIKVWRNGTPRLYTVDPEVAKAVNGMGRQEIDAVVDMISKPARWLRAGAVLAPDFLARNLTRDQLSAAIFSKNGYIPFIDYLRGVGHMAWKSKHYENWLKSGGANSNLVTLERRYVRDQLDNMRESGWMQKLWNNKNPIKFLEKASEYSEQPSRIAEFVRSQKRGKTTHESGFESREVTVDFARHGASKAMQNFSQATAFFNPTIQGHDRLARAFIDNPYSTAFKIGAYITLPTLMAYAYNRQDPRMKDVPRQERDTYWHYPTNDWRPISQEEMASLKKHGAGPIPKDWSNWIKTDKNGQTYFNYGEIHRIPKPHEMGVFFGSSVERSLDAYFYKHPDAFKGFTKSLASATLPPLLPQAGLAPIEAITNYRFFTESPLVPKRVSSPRDRQYEYTPFTTETAKLVGNIIGQVAPESQLASPIVLENYVSAWAGTLGRYTLQLMDASMEGGRRTAAALKGDNRKPKVSPEWSEADIPVWRAFVTRLPATSAQPVRDFYQNLESSTTAKALMSRVAKSSEFEDSSQRGLTRGRIAAAHPEATMALNMAKTGVAVNRMFKAMEMIMNNRDMTPREKRRAIDMLSINMMYATTQANDAFRKFNELARKQQDGVASP